MVNRIDSNYGQTEYDFSDGYLNIMLMMTCVLISICMGYILLIISFWVYVDYIIQFILVVGWGIIIVIIIGFKKVLYVCMFV